MESPRTGIRQYSQRVESRMQFAPWAWMQRRINNFASPEIDFNYGLRERSQFINQVGHEVGHVFGFRGRDMNRVSILFECEFALFHSEEYSRLMLSMRLCVWTLENARRSNNQMQWIVLMVLIREIVEWNWINGHRNECIRVQLAPTTTRHIKRSDHYEVEDSVAPCLLVSISRIDPNGIVPAFEVEVHFTRETTKLQCARVQILNYQVHGFICA